MSRPDRSKHLQNKKRQNKHTTFADCIRCGKRAYWSEEAHRWFHTKPLRDEDWHRVSVD